MINLTNRLICYLTKHKIHETFLEQCPYTGQTYQLCTRCTALQPIIQSLLSDPDTKELLDRLGSDYDENGIPYWENGRGDK